MKLFYSPTSPYVRKVRVVLAEKGLACDLVAEDVWGPDSRVARHNPLGKIPALLLDDGECLYDSRVIAEYLDGLAAPALIPPAGLERARARRVEALADGICDAAVAIVLERKRDAARQDAAWIDRQRGKIVAGFEALARDLGERRWLGGEAPGLADLAAGCAIFYVEFRLPELGCRPRHPNLAGFADRLEARPSFAATRPPAG
jgi:glutathione S-transferase